MTKQFSKYLIRIITVIVTLAILFLADEILALKTEHGIKQAKYMYAQPKDSVDVVMLGSSHIHCDVNTALLWDEYGITAYNYSTAEQPLWITYYYLKEICKYQDPKVAVIDLYGPAHFKDDYQYSWLADSLFGYRFSLDKIAMMHASAEFDALGGYFPDFFNYHHRYDELTLDDFREPYKSRKEKAAYKGYTPYFNEQEQTEPELNETKSGGITVKSEIYLQKIIDFASENDIEIFFIVTPYITNSEDELVYNRIKEIAVSERIHFISSNYDYSVMDINFEEDFNDASHLNYSGSCKFSRYLAEELLQRFELSDHRGDSYYESWDRHSKEISELCRKNLK